VSLPDPRVLEEARERELALKQREQQIAIREEALAAQKKVIEEEARLLASARTAGQTGAIGAFGGQGAATTPRVAAIAPVHQAPVAPGAPNSPRPPVVPAASFVTPTGVRVQRYQPTPYPRPQARYGMWERLRRVLFGVTEPETGA
jgi:hypothetical protein